MTTSPKEGNSPKEKAKELVEKFNEPTQEWVDNDQEYGWLPNLENAKACALIAVDEIMRANIMEYPQHNTIYSPHKNDYWQQVKEAINQL